MTNIISLRLEQEYRKSEHVSLDQCGIREMIHVYILAKLAQKAHALSPSAAATPYAACCCRGLLLLWQAADDDDADDTSGMDHLHTPWVVGPDPARAPPRKHPCGCKGPNSA